MSSRPSEPYLARLLRKIRTGEIWERLVLSITPISGLKSSRRQIIDLYADVYFEIDEFQDAFSEYSNPNLRDWAVEPVTQIPEYDPHEPVRSLLSFPSRVVTLLKHLSIVIVALGSILSINKLYSLGKGGISLLETTEGLLPLSFIALGIIYLWLLHTDTFVHQTLAKELRTGRAKVATRRRPHIVAYGVWNRSLLSQTGLFLAGAFYLLDSLPELPLVGRFFDDPVEYVTTVIIENVDLFYQQDSLIRAFWNLFRRVR